MSIQDQAGRLGTLSIHFTQGEDRPRMTMPLELIVRHVDAQTGETGPATCLDLQTRELLANYTANMNVVSGEAYELSYESSVSSRECSR